MVADHTWAANKGREALKIEWDRGAHADFDSNEFMQVLELCVFRRGLSDPPRR